MASSLTLLAITLTRSCPSYILGCSRLVCLWEGNYFFCSNYDSRHVCQISLANSQYSASNEPLNIWPDSLLFELWRADSDHVMCNIIILFDVKSITSLTADPTAHVRVVYNSDWISPCFSQALRQFWILIYHFDLFVNIYKITWNISRHCSNATETKQFRIQTIIFISEAMLWCSVISHACPFLPRTPQHIQQLSDQYCDTFRNMIYDLFQKTYFLWYCIVQII